MTKTMKDCIGIDISKDHLGVHRLGTGASTRFTNDPDGFRSLKRWIGYLGAEERAVAGASKRSNPETKPGAKRVPEVPNPGTKPDWIAATLACFRSNRGSPEGMLGPDSVETAGLKFRDSSLEGIDTLRKSLLP